MTESQPTQTSIILIEGSGRSGSTMIQALLARASDSFALGELGRVWDHGFLRNELCSCGLRTSDCEFWAPIFESWTGDTARLALIVRRRDELLARSTSAALDAKTALVDNDFAGAHRALLRDITARIAATHSKTSASIVDSTKHPNYGVLVRRLPEVDVRSIHIVRHPAAVCYSLGRLKRRSDVYWDEEYMPRYSPLRGALAWRRRNSALERIYRRLGPATKLRYEDLARGGESVLSSTMRAAGIEPQDKRADEAKDRQHIIAGNPRKMETLDVIEEDKEWISEMPLHTKAIVGLITGRLRQSYGYSVTDVK